MWDWEANLRRGAWVIGFCGLLVAGTTATAAAADKAVTTLDSKATPWAKGVTPKAKEEANRLLALGNELLKDSFFAQAADKYRASLEIWDHPGGHYNLALALLSLNQPLVTYSELEKSVAHGPEPLGQDKYDYAQKYLALLEHQVVHVEVSCQEPGAEVRMDGRLLYRAPGRYAGIVERGDHVFIASKPGFETTQLTRTLDSGEPYKLELDVYRESELQVFQRKYPLWIPVTLSAVGLAVAGAGAASLYLSQDAYNGFDDTILNDPDCAFGCQPSDDAQADLDRGNMMRTMGYVGLGVGGAALATGVTLWIFGGETRRVTPEEKGKFAVTPLFAPGGGGLVGSGTF